MTFKYGLIFLIYSSTDSVLFLSLLLSYLILSKITYSYWFIIIFFFFILKKIFIISEYYIFNYFILLKVLDFPSLYFVKKK